jgi:hypothetical protein
MAELLLGVNIDHIASPLWYHPLQRPVRQRTYLPGA